ncbi:hypothetical protein [Butyrivibrio sp. AE3004]|uniref:hypothetical protein n=1 Tax=Butyrivibrio sp. AE3004 TaxID=1506994 RepID=UPI0004943F31|nr:hypothetical protein [Butyrivibrio sp. AE3004]
MFRKMRGYGQQISEPIHGMWNLDRYVNLLMGEIPWLQDDINGYGPKYGKTIREVNPLYASLSGETQNKTKIMEKN